MLCVTRDEVMLVHRASRPVNAVRDLRRSPLVHTSRPPPQRTQKYPVYHGRQFSLPDIRVPEAQTCPPRVWTAAIIAPPPHNWTRDSELGTVSRVASPNQWALYLFGCHCVVRGLCGTNRQNPPPCPGHRNFSAVPHDRGWVWTCTTTVQQVFGSFSAFWQDKHRDTIETQ